MPFELTQRFYFEAAHTLRRQVGAAEADASRRIHGHTYHAAVTLGGEPDPATGMVADLAQLREAIAAVREALDHRMLDDLPGLGPATLENLCRHIFQALRHPHWQLLRVEVSRPASGDSCCYSPAPAP
jgi:6-pyruvoyltetrahydropterin/6-carboxytetrahydropterin synthase